MNGRRFSFLLLLCLGLSSCFPLTSNSFKKIKVDDTEERVIKVLGRPTSKRAYYSKEYMIYYVHDDFFSIFFNMKQFPFVGFYPLLRTGQEYWVILEGGKVVAFGLAKNFGNNIPRALNSNGVDLGITKF